LPDTDWSIEGDLHTASSTQRGSFSQQRAEKTSKVFDTHNNISTEQLPPEHLMLPQFPDFNPLQSHIDPFLIPSIPLHMDYSPPDSVIIESHSGVDRASATCFKKPVLSLALVSTSRSIPGKGLPQKVR
jgi:hypothetical protein